MKEQTFHKGLWIAAGVGVILSTVLLISLDASNSAIGGDAVSGYREEGSYFASVEKGDSYQEISATQWYLNWGLWIVAPTVSLITVIMVGIAIFLDISLRTFRHWREGGSNRIG